MLSKGLVARVKIYMMSTTILSACLLAYLALWSPADAFSPREKAKPTHDVSQKSLSFAPSTFGPTRLPSLPPPALPSKFAPSRRSGSNLILFDNFDNDSVVDNAADAPTNEPLDDALDDQQQPVSALERIRILSYRITLSTSALLLTITAILDSNFLSGTGINGAGIVANCEGILPVAAGLSLVLAPMPGGAAGIAATSLGGAAVAFAVLSSITGDMDMVSDVSHFLGIISLVGICLREIYYFGLAYKWEAAIALLTLPLLVVDRDAYTVYPIAVPICALAMDVLAAGKVFEPMREEYVKSNSEFLAE